MDAFLFELEVELTLLSPLFWSFELQEGSLGVSCVNSKLLCIVYFQAVDPNVDILLLVD